MNQILVMASAASSSSGNRCDGTNEQLVRTQTEGKTSASLSTNGPFLFIWLPSEETCSVLMLAVGPASDDRTYNEPLLHLLFRDRKHSVGAVVSSFFPQTLSASLYAAPDEIWFLKDVCGLTDVWFRSKLKPQPFHVREMGAFQNSSTPVNVRTLLLPAGLQSDLLPLRRDLSAGPSTHQPY